MEIDLTKLSPASWKPDIGASQCPDEDFDLWFARGPMRKLPYSRREEVAADAAFIALARNAFDVMMRRGWMPIKHQDKDWYASFEADEADAFFGLDTLPVQKGVLYPDPFTALVEADKWYKENVEKGNALST